jgi:pimeloyl-ACP methyl ester carboxylesterase
MKKFQQPETDKKHWARLLGGVAIALVGLIIVMEASFGIAVRQVQFRGVPLSIYVASEPVRIEWHMAAHAHDDPEAEQVDHELTPRLPGVIIVHGFSGSHRLMTGYAQKLSHSGYGVVLLDLAGHGDNDNPFDRERFQAEVDAAYDVLVDQSEIDPTRVALIGHSMGSGVVVEAALRNPERYSATVAISPVAADVTPLTPRNLQLQAGTWEPRFMATAGELLERAGGASDDFINGRARELVSVSGAEHLGILFRTASHDAALAWLDQALAADPTLREPYTDRRLLGWLLQVIGWMLVIASMARMYAPPQSDRLRRPWHWAGAALAPLAATLACIVISRVFDLSQFLGVMVGGGLGLWMLVAGCVYLFGATTLRLPKARLWLRGAIVFVILWLVLGVSAEFVWLSWGLTSARLLVWPLLAVMSMPWFVAAAAVQEESGTSPLIWWAIHTAGMVVGLLVLGWTVPGMSLVTLIVPLIGFFLAVLAHVTTRFNDPWVAGIGCGAFWGWMLAAAFPYIG